MEGESNGEMTRASGASPSEADVCLALGSPVWRSPHRLGEDWVDAQPPPSAAMDIGY